MTPDPKCPHCGMQHTTTCPRIKAIEYHTDGVTVKRIEFHDNAQTYNLPSAYWPRSVDER